MVANRFLSLYTVHNHSIYIQNTSHVHITDNYIVNFLNSNLKIETITLLMNFNKQSNYSFN